MSTTPPEDVAEELDALGTRAREIVCESRSALLDGKDPATLGAVVTDAESVIDDAIDLDKKLYERGLEEGYLLGTVLDSIVRTAEYGVNLAEAGLQATMRETTNEPA